MNAVNEQEPVRPHNAVLLADQPYVVVDACGRFEPQPSVATVSRLTQSGVARVNTRVVVLEAMADIAHPKAKEIYATLPAGLVMDDARGSSRRCQDSALCVKHGRADLRVHPDHHPAAYFTEQPEGSMHASRSNSTS